MFYETTAIGFDYLNLECENILLECGPLTEFFNEIGTLTIFRNLGEICA